MTSAWPSVRLGDLCDFVNGGTPSREVPEYFDGDIPWITGADIVGPVANTCRTRITEAGVRSSPASQVAEGTVLLVTRTSVGKVAVAGMPLAFSQDITALLQDRTRVTAGYLVQFLATQASRFKHLARGATIQGITRDVVAETEIPLPPIEEQRRIAAILDKADELRTKRRAALAQLDTLTEAIFIDMFGDPVTNPTGHAVNDGWRRLRLGEVATLQRGYDLPVQLRRSGSIPIYAANGTVGTHDTPMDNGPGVITGRSGTIGKVHYSPGPFWPLNTSLYVRDFHGNDPRFVYWLLRSMDLTRFHEGSGVPTLNRNIVHRVEVDLPPIEQQRRFGQLAGQIGGPISMSKESVVSIETLFASLQQRAFSGAL